MSEDPREALLKVAREIVAKRGYVGLSVRTASAAAGVTEDVARRYYRNRESLFAAAMRLPVDPVSALPALMAPGIEGMGERLVRFTLETLRDPEARDDLMSLARTGVSAGQAVTGLQDFIEVGVVDRVAGMIGVPDARMRSALITSYLLGVATMRYGVRLEPLASASDEEVIRMVAPVIQDLLDPRRPIPGSARARARSAPAGPQEPAHGQRVRTFDPDPAATRAAQAARQASAQATQPGGGSAAAARATPTPRAGATGAARPATKATGAAAPTTKATAAKRATPTPTTTTRATGTTRATAAKKATGTTKTTGTTKKATGTTKKATATVKKPTAPVAGPKHAQAPDDAARADLAPSAEATTQQAPSQQTQAGPGSGD